MFLSMGKVYWKREAATKQIIVLFYVFFLLLLFAAGRGSGRSHLTFKV